jgi:hypothetical protein
MKQTGCIIHGMLWERCEMHTIFWLENQKGRDHLEDLGVDGKIKGDWILGK